MLMTVCELAPWPIAKLMISDGATCPWRRRSAATLRGKMGRTSAGMSIPVRRLKPILVPSASSVSSPMRMPSW